MQRIVIAHNLRSTHNVGSIFRSCDGFGVNKLYLTGYTPYPIVAGDRRLPHVRDRLTRQIHKTALGAESSTPFEYVDDPATAIAVCRQGGFRIVALEQTAGSISLAHYKPPDKLALVLGEEVHGIPPELLKLCDDAVEIPMSGNKESFNVSVAAGIALFALSTKA